MSVTLDSEVITSALDDALRRLIRDELRQCVHPDALKDPESLFDDQALQERAHEAATRIRGARKG